MEDIKVMDEMNEAVVVEACEDLGNSGKGLIGAIALGVGLVAAGVAVYLHKTKDKREARKIEKLRAKGYTILEPVEAETEENVFEVEPKEV